MEQFYIPVFGRHKNDSTLTRVKSLEKSLNLCQTLEGQREGNSVSIMKSLITQERRICTDSPYLVPLYDVLKQFTFEYHESAVPYTKQDRNMNKTRSTMTVEGNWFDITSKSLKLLPPEFLADVKNTVKNVMDQIDKHADLVAKSKLLQKKLTYHREIAEMHFTKYEDYNNSYFAAKYCGGSDDISKIEKKMNNEGKIFSHHDDIAQEAFKENNRSRQQSEVMIKQVKQTLQSLEEVIESQITKALENRISQLQHVVEKLQFSQQLKDKLDHLDTHLIAENMYKQICAAKILNTSTSPAVVQKTEMVENCKSGGEYSKKVDIKEHSRVPGMKIKQKFVSGDGTVAFGYKTSRLGIKKWCFYNTKQKSP